MVTQCGCCGGISGCLGFEAAARPLWTKIGRSLRLAHTYTYRRPLRFCPYLDARSCPRAIIPGSLIWTLDRSCLGTPWRPTRAECVSGPPYDSKKIHPGMTCKDSSRHGYLVPITKNTFTRNSKSSVRVAPTSTFAIWRRRNTA